MSDTSDLLMGSIHGDGLHICGIAPKQRLVTWDDDPCSNCQGTRVVRCWSGSGWYDDSYLCPDCGEDVGTGYRPFKPAWRKENIARAEGWMQLAIPREEFFALTSALVKTEMGWDDPEEHTFRTFDDRDVCDMCEHPLTDHPMSAVEHEPPDAATGDDPGREGQ